MKKNFTKILAMVLLMCAVSAVLPTATLATEAATIQPRYIGLSELQATLAIDSSGRASCNGVARTYSGYTVNLTLALQESKDGKLWTTIETWTDSTSSKVDFGGVYHVISGKSYRTKLTAEVYTSAGNYVESPFFFSDTIKF